MAILKIARMGHPVLQRTAAAVDDPGAPDIVRLVDDMLETLDDIGGLGLAAPQVHVSRQVVVFHLPAARAADDEAVLEMTVICNPVITPLDDETVEGWEGCLSIPGLRGLVPRARRISYTGLGLDGGKIEREAEGMHARIVQHECDHLAGVLYPQRMRDLRNLVFETELRHVIDGDDDAESDE